jgi:hypothetical protein
MRVRGAARALRSAPAARESVTETTGDRLTSGSGRAHVARTGFGAIGRQLERLRALCDRAPPRSAIPRRIPAADLPRAPTRIELSPGHL